jgi:iron complex transport system permease protein
METNKPALKDKRSYRIAVIIGNATGTIKISFTRIIDVILHADGTTEWMTVWNIRLPRMILAALVGVNLALSGAILQGVMGNPLADPSIIGISSGAGLFGIFILVVVPQYQELVPIAAFIGAMLAATLIYLLAWKGGIQPIRIILAGVAVSALFSAGISGTLVFFSDRVHGALTFMNGSLSSRSWGEVYTILPYTLAGLVLSLLSSQRLNILILGDDVARGLGLHVERTRLFSTALAGLLAASAVSVVGLLGFVGLIVPHSVRLLIGNDYRSMLPASALLGAALVMFSDTLARTLFSPTEIPVGIVMAIIGVPFFLYLLRR